MSEVKRAITDAMRQRIYEMWIAGYKVANIAADLGVNDHTVKSELERGYTGDIYIDLCYVFWLLAKCPLFSPYLYIY